MRSFVDAAGKRWDVVLGRESWGTLVVLFVPAGREPVRQAYFEAMSYDTSVAELDELSPDRLQQLLDSSEPRPES